MGRILIVDDDRALREALSMLLLSEGFEVHALEDPEYIVQEALRFAPDLILCDLFLPRHSGLQIARLLRREPQSAHIPLVAISGSRQVEAHLQQMGAHAFLAKPFDVDELLHIIRSTLQETSTHPR